MKIWENDVWFSCNWWDCDEWGCDVNTCFLLSQWLGVSELWKREGWLFLVSIEWKASKCDVFGTQPVGLFDWFLGYYYTAAWILRKWRELLGINIWVTSFSSGEISKSESGSKFSKQGWYVWLMTHEFVCKAGSLSINLNLKVGTWVKSSQYVFIYWFLLVLLPFIVPGTSNSIKHKLFV